MIVLYSTGCPNCKIIKKKMVRDGIDFLLSNDIDKLIEKGYQSAPILEVDGNFMEYKQAVDWIKNRGKAE